MSFRIALQRNSSPDNKVDKVITDVAYATGDLKSGTSIIDPSIVIDSALETDMLKNVNYATIELFGRSYFVTNILVGTTGLWEIHMHVDVLYTYRDKIRQQTAIVKRSETAYNMHLDDGWFMAYQNPKFEKRYFTVANPFESQEYVLVLAGS